MSSALHGNLIKVKWREAAAVLPDCVLWGERQGEAALPDGWYSMPPPPPRPHPEPQHCDFGGDWWFWRSKLFCRKRKEDMDRWRGTRRRMGGGKRLFKWGREMWLYYWKSLSERSWATRQLFQHPSRHSDFQDKIVWESGICNCLPCGQSLFFCTKNNFSQAKQWSFLWKGCQYVIPSLTIVSSMSLQLREVILWFAFYTYRNIPVNWKMMCRGQEQICSKYTLCEWERKPKGRTSFLEKEGERSNKNEAEAGPRKGRRALWAGLPGRGNKQCCAASEQWSLTESKLGQFLSWAELISPIKV